MDILCFTQSVYECQTQNQKRGTSWKFLKFQKSGSIITIPIRKKNTVRAYRWVIKRLCNDFGGEELSEISPDKILQFFNTITEGCRPRTKRVRFAHLSSFFNFLKNNRDPKSGKEQEVVFIPPKVADRLREYARQNCKNPNDRIFPISYEAARIMVLKAGNMAGIYLRPHDLRRHAATYASRAGVPIEIISKIILRHANLSTTQRYLGKVTDVEAIRWIENLYA